MGAHMYSGIKSGTQRIIFGGAIMVGVLAAETASRAAESALDRGGVSVDFRQFKQIDTTKGGATEKKNLLENGSFEQIDPKTNLPVGWQNDFWYYVDSPDKWEHIKKLSPLGTRRLSPASPADGKCCFELGMADENADKNTGKASFSNNLNTTVAGLKLEADEKYILSFRYKAEYSTRGGKLSVYIPFIGADGKEARPHVFQDVPGASAEWKSDQVEFVAPKGTEKFHIQFRFTDYGRAFIDDVRLTVDKAPGSVTMAVLPFSFIDDTFALPSGQIGILQLTGRNAVGRKLKTPSIVVTLPEEIRILALRNGPKAMLGQRPLEREGKKFIEYQIAYSMPAQIRQDQYEWAYGEFILLQTDLPAGETAYPAECQFADEDFKGEPRRFNIKVIAPVHGRQPKLFETGAHIWNEFTYAEPAALKTLADFYTGTGFNVIQLGTSSTPPMSAAFKAAGVRRYIQRLMVNGYTVHAKLPDEVKYRGVDNAPVGGGICPVAIYGKSKYYTETMVPELRKIIVEDDLADSLMCNWEPYMYVFNGCFCDNCRTAFVKYAKLPAAEVATAWPKDVARTYAAVWPAFRSWQHAQLVLTLEETAADFGKSVGKQSHFIPEIHNGFTLKEWARSQYDPRDYMEKLPVIEAWGPYLFHRYTRPYVYKLGNHLSLYQRAVEPADYLRSAIADGAKRPALIAFPSGVVCADWILEPEAIAFETLCYFIGGWQGSIAYFFPSGYDGRYFQAMADANTLIADHEEIVFKGRRLDKKDRFTMQPLSPLPPVDPRVGSDLEPSLLQGQEFAHGDRRLFVVGNFWQRGDVWVKIVPANLSDDGKFVLREVSRNRCFANEGGKASLTADELRKGVTVHVGALRWAFFTLEPWRDGADYGEIVPPARLDACLNERRGGLQKSLEAEQALTATERQKQQPPDFSKFAEMTAGGAACRLEKKASGAGQDVVFTVPAGRLVIDPVNGAKITSWRHAGVELVAPDNGLAIDGLMLPAPAFIKGPYQFVEQAQTATALSVTFSKELTADEYGYELGGLTMRKTFTVPVDGSGFTVSSAFRNDADHEVAFSFRYHNVPVVMVGGKDLVVWRAVMPGQDGQTQTLDLTRGLVELFRCKPSDAEIDKRSSSAKQYAIAKPLIDIDWPQGVFKLQVDYPDPNSLYGILFWGFSAGDKPHSTLEPLFDKVSLPQGQLWTAGMSWRVKK